jgi:hypothetical protein
LIFHQRRGNFTLTKLIFCAGLIFPGFPAMAEPSKASSSLAYGSFICWKYPQLSSLRAWKETEKIIATTLAESYPTLQRLERLENGSPQQLRDFLSKLPDGPNHLTLIYLAAHQSHGGQWYFTDRSVFSWEALMNGLPKRGNSQQIVLLDCCYAKSTNLWPDWPQKIAPACIYASPGNRPTPDLFVFHRRPVDWPVLFPEASQWLRQHHFDDDDDERISFFGLIWLKAWLDQPKHPQNLGEWNDLAQKMALISQQASSQISSGSISEISSIFPPREPGLKHFLFR